VKSAMIYPIAVIVIASLVVAVICGRSFRRLPSSSPASVRDLPLPTRVVIWMSHSLVTYSHSCSVSGPLARGVSGPTTDERRRHVIDRVVLRLPILGLIMRKIAVARFCRTLATLISSGVPIRMVWKITAKTSGNAVIEDAINGNANEHRTWRNDCGAAQRTAAVPPDGRPDDSALAKATGALRHDAREDCRTSTKRKWIRP